MMADFHDTTERAGEALAAVESVEAEARSTRGGSSRVAHPMWIGYSTGNDCREAHPMWIGYSTSSDRRGAVPSGSGAPLATPPPEPAARGRNRHP
jgi:hypothetical protein